MDVVCAQRMYCRVAFGNGSGEEATPETHRILSFQSPKLFVVSDLHLLPCIFFMDIASFKAEI